MAAARGTGREVTVSEQRVLLSPETGHSSLVLDSAEQVSAEPQYRRVPCRTSQYHAKILGPAAAASCSEPWGRVARRARLALAVRHGESEALRISGLSKVTSQPSRERTLKSRLQPPALPASVANIASAFFCEHCGCIPLCPAPRRCSASGDRCYLPAAVSRGNGRLHVLAIAFALEVSVGKTNTVMALNNSDVLLPCTFTTCIGFQDLVFTWYFNSTEMIYHGKIKSKASEPFLVGRNPRVEFVGSTTGKDNNISIVLKNVDFSDAGKYTCHVKNPKEKNAQHNATIILTVVQKMVETDNTLTLIIVSVVGGLIGLLILFMLIKRVVLFIIKKTQDGKKECLVSSSGNDNTENGLAGSKAEQKAPPKA
ncbi:PREDICTED: sodium channel subunit beta-4 [Charadrius vociferus]|uniref:sodium channel subunit beta-4 n=1 Tax=Charadrius vociferus TaxID=50402 RepID=UPI000521B155|nr:PREDICTED: sodium channel subunit beta-4 [Charadrius vociferus]